MLSFIDGNWAVATPEGRFDSSLGDELVDGLHWVVRGKNGPKPVALNQVKGFYEKGLLERVWAGKPAPFPVTDFSKYPVRPDPIVDVVEPKPGDRFLTIHLTDDGGGIGPVQVKVDGAALPGDARPAGFDPRVPRATIRVDLSALASLSGNQARKITVTARNAFGDVLIDSRAIDVGYVPTTSAASAPSRFFALCVGVSDYADPELRLKYATRDARDFADALTIAARKLFGSDRVKIARLVSDADSPSEKPTRANIAAAIEAIRREARPADVCLLYFAGHGVSFRTDNSTAREADVYCFPTMEASTLDPVTLRTKSFQETRAITSGQMASWMNARDGILATKKVLILDTCSAGAVGAQMLAAMREITPEDSARARALSQLRDQTAFHILMGCANNRASYEAGEYDQGLLTYSLLEGMQGAALKDDTIVDVPTLFAWSKTRVPQLAKDIGGVQEPDIASPRGVALPIGQIDRAERGNVRLASRKHRLLPPTFLDQGTGGDGELQLTATVSARLRETGYATARGGGFVYLPAGEIIGALKPSGIYTIDGDSVRLNLVLLCGNERLKAEVLTGRKADAAGFAKAVADAIERLVAEIPLAPPSAPSN